MLRTHRLACVLGCALVLTIAAPSAEAARKRKAKAKPATETVSPACTDFHAFANEAWLNAHPLAPGVPSLSAMQQLEQRVVAQQAALLDAAMTAPQGDRQRWLGDLWASGLDEAVIERSGATPIAPLLERIGKIRRAKDVPAVIAALHAAGIPVAFQFGGDLDLDAPDRHIGYFSEGGLGLPDPAFYTRTDTDTRQLLGRYNGYVQKILMLAGTPADKAAAEAQQVIDLETRLARAARPLSELRDARANYAPVSTATLDKTWRRLQLAQFLKAQGVSADTVSITHPPYFEALDGLLGSLKPAQWKTWLRWRVADAMAPYLARSWRDAHFDFHGRVLSAQSTPPQRRDAALQAVNRFAGHALGEEYTQRHLAPAARARAGEIADNLRRALDAAIDGDLRLGAPAKAEAKAKLAALRMDIGVPSASAANALPALDRSDFGGNVLRLSAWRHAEDMRRIGAAGTERSGDVLPQQPALAYDGAHNRLIATAAVLQAPVLDPDADLPTQYGAFGALVGRELLHAIDDKGRFVDAQGRSRDWWTPAEATAWEALANGVAGQYANRPVTQAPGTRLDGQRVRDVALADQAGLELAWKALHAAQPGANAQGRQAFFLAWARLWAQQLGPEAASAHASSAWPTGAWRANGPLINLAAFGESFGCKADAPMQVKAEQQIVLWPAILPAAAGGKSK